MIPLDHMSGKSVGVLGLGASGRAAAAALIAAGAKVTAWDDNEAARKTADDLALQDLASQQVDVLVSSPGIAMTYPAPHPAIAFAMSNGAAVCGDVELFAQARDALPTHKVVAITGTNGKSTTTALIAHLLNAAGITAVIGGNFGPPILSLTPAECIYVLELSSFQLEQTASLVSDIAVFLNLTPDHSDRYASMAHYGAAKQRLFDMQGHAGKAVIAVDSLEGQRLAKHVKNQVISIGQPYAAWCVDNGTLKHHGQAISQQHDWPALQGPHNAQNAAAAAAVCFALGVAYDGIAAGLAGYQALAHRAQPVGQTGQIAFINDSKATNPDATAKSLQAYSNIYWLAGGSDKGSDFSSLAEHIKSVRAAYFFGQTRTALKAQVSGVKSQLFETMDSAFAAALRDARQSGMACTIVLSPACASFDQFRNFAHRGEVFTALVKEVL